MRMTTRRLVAAAAVAGLLIGGESLAKEQKKPAQGPAKKERQKERQARRPPRPRGGPLAGWAWGGPIPLNWGRMADDLKLEGEKQKAFLEIGARLDAEQAKLKLETDKRMADLRRKEKEAKKAKDNEALKALRQERSTVRANAADSVRAAEGEFQKLLTPAEYKKLANVAKAHSLDAQLAVRLYNQMRTAEKLRETVYGLPNPADEQQEGFATLFARFKEQADAAKGPKAKTEVDNLTRRLFGEVVSTLTAEQKKQLGRRGPASGVRPKSGRPRSRPAGRNR